ncbi:lysylphosphatidylglycerol synthase transmembrane domain-containing protein [Bifidobacterium aemilianum]|nr:lysylphosphatidylglycerol synthase transmembrane domain-containing protein [Bifidobacterium aemilianum]
MSAQGADQLHIEDRPPRRTRDFGDLIHAVLAVIAALAVIIVALYLRGITSGVESDAHSAGQALNWIMDLPASMLQQLATIIIVVSVLLHLLINREWLQSAATVIALFGGYLAIWSLSTLLTQLGNPALLSSMASFTSNQGPTLLPDIYAGVGAFLTVAGPRRTHSTVKWGWNILYGVAVILVVMSWHSVTGVCVSFAVGRVVGMVIRFVIGTRNQGSWGRQIMLALDSIGLDLVSLERRTFEQTESKVLQADPDDDLIENSRTYDALDSDGHRYIVSVLDNQTHMAGYLNQLWQWVRLSGVSMRRDRSASMANHHHLAMLLGLANAGLATPNAYGVADSDESSILVFRAEAAPLACNLDTLSDRDAKAFMTYLGTAHARGYTHRRITPDTLVHLPSGQAIIGGWQNGDCASGSANMALDKVQLLVLCASLIGLDRTLPLAQEAWGLHQLLDLAPFVQRAAVPSATRALPAWDKRVLADIRERLKAMAPEEADQSTENVALSRFSLRSFLVLALGIIAAAVIFTQLRPDEVIAALKQAKASSALVCVLFGFLAWVGSAIALGAFLPHDKRHPLPLYCTQAASGFTAVSMPAGVGPAFVNLQYLRKNGFTTTAATAITSAAWAIQSLMTIILIFVIGIFTGRNSLSGMIPTNTLVIVIGAVVLLLSASMAIAPLRRLITDKYLPMLKAYGRQLLDVLSQPKQLGMGVLGAFILNVATGLGFWAALLAFGYQTNPVETIFIFLLANTLGSAVPTPGGLGAVEAALTFAFSSVGVPAAVALSATLLYRVSFYWLRIPVGAMAMKWLGRHKLI